MAKGKELALPDMNETEAKAWRDTVNQLAGEYHAKMRQRVGEGYARRAWKALGYTSWEAMCEKEFGYTRQRAYQILEEEEVANSLKDKNVELSGRALRALGKAESPAALLDAAQKEHGTKTPTAPQIKTTRQRTASKKKTTPTKVKPIGEQAADDEKLLEALKTIGDECGRNFRKAIEDGTIPMLRNEVVKLSDLEPLVMRQTEELLAKGWKLPKALDLLNSMPELTDRVEQLTWRALAHTDGDYVATFGAFTVTVHVNRKKL